MPKLTARQESVLKKHSKHHTAKHMAMMRKEMKAGKSFTAAHKKAKAMERKIKKKREKDYMQTYMPNVNGVAR